MRPFLRNLFSDPAIIGAPGPVRLVAAEAISRLRERSAIRNYAVMGGGSPLNAETKAQAEALQARLRAERPADEVQVFTAMRYWRPMTADTAAEVAAFAPDEVVLLPLYPQFSTTTTASSLAAWAREYGGSGRQHTVCCYFDQPNLVEAHASLIQATWEAAGSPPGVRVLFSAHGLPERISAGGDPYRWQVERTCAAVAQRLGGLSDWRVCYQSRVGPLKWIGPSTVEEIEAAGAEGLGVIVDPIAFVSEHIETLVELDRDYAEVAARVGAAPYLRVPALGIHPAFLEALTRLALGALGSAQVRPGASSCAEDLCRCAMKAAAA